MPHRICHCWNSELDHPSEGECEHFDLRCALHIVQGGNFDNAISVKLCMDSLVEYKRDVMVTRHSERSSGKVGGE